MKTNVIMKIAVVFMAAFGAYAFSGNANLQSSFYIHENNECHDIEVGCTTDGEYNCTISTNGNLYQVWSDLGCEIRTKHNDSKPIKM